MSAVAESASLELTVHIDQSDPVFDGHYPGFPILPGLFLVEHVHRAVRESVGGRRVVELDRVRFRKPVYPGDSVSVEVRLEPAGADLVCSAVLSVDAEKAATLRLRYAEGDTA